MKNLDRGSSTNGQELEKNDLVETDEECNFWESEINLIKKCSKIEGKNVLYYNYKDILPFIFFHWTRKWIDVLTKNYLDPFKLHPLPKGDQVLYWQPIFSKYVSDMLIELEMDEFKTSQTKGYEGRYKPKKLILLRAILYTFWIRILLATIGMIAINILSMSIAILLSKMLKLMKASQSHYGSILGLILFIICLELFKGICIDHVTFYIQRLIVMLDYSLGITLFQHGLCMRRNYANIYTTEYMCNNYIHLTHGESKCVKNPFMCPARRHKNIDINPKMYSYKFVDSYYVTLVFDNLSDVITFLTNFIYGTILLHVQMKVKIWLVFTVSVSLVVLMILIETLNSYLLKYYYSLRDHRVSKSFEIITNFKLIRTMTLEDIADNTITDVRNDELTLIVYRFFLSLVNKILYTVCVTCALLIIIRDFVSQLEKSTDVKSIDASSIITLLFILLKIIDPMYMLPLSLRLFIIVLNSYNRIEFFIRTCSPNYYLFDKFLVDPNVKYRLLGNKTGFVNQKIGLDKLLFPNYRPSNGKIVSVSDGNVIKFEKANFGWIYSREQLLVENNTVYLEDVDFTLRRGEFVIVTGPQGSGKSNFLKAILGEMTLVGGSMFVYPLSKSTPIFYASQDVWIKRGTVRTNILFGHYFDEEIYSNVIKAVELDTDMANWENGDLRATSESGFGLSGGQRVRIEFARAIYAYMIYSKVNKEYSRTGNFLMCLDAVFLGLDPFVGGNIFHNLFNVKDGLLIRPDLSVVLTTSKRSLETCISSCGSNTFGDVKMYTLRNKKLGFRYTLKTFIQRLNNMYVYDDQYVGEQISESKGRNEDSNDNKRDVEEDINNSNNIKDRNIEYEEIEKVRKYKDNKKGEDGSNDDENKGKDVENKEDIENNNEEELFKRCRSTDFNRDRRKSVVRTQYDNRSDYGCHKIEGYKNIKSIVFGPMLMYIKSAGISFYVFLFFLVTCTVLDNMRYIFASNLSNYVNDHIVELSDFVDDKEKCKSIHSLIRDYSTKSFKLIGYLSVFVIITCVSVVVLMTVVSFTSSLRIHEYSLDSSLYNSSAFVKIKRYVSDVITFLSCDTLYIDNALGYYLFDSFVLLVETLIHMIMLMYLVPTSLIFVLLASFLIIRFPLLWFIKALSNIRFAYMASTNRINCVLNDSISGSMVYRSYRKEQELVSEFVEHADYNARCRFMERASYTWASVTCRCIFSAMIFFVILTPLTVSRFTDYKIKIGYYGLAFSLSLNFTNRFSKLLRIYTRLQLYLCSIKRFENFIPTNEKLYFKPKKNVYSEYIVVNSMKENNNNSNESKGKDNNEMEMMKEKNSKEYKENQEKNKCGFDELKYNNLTSKDNMMTSKKFSIEPNELFNCVDMSKIKETYLLRRKREFYSVRSRMSIRNFFFNPKINLIDLTEYLEPVHKGIKLENVFVILSSNKSLEQKPIGLEELEDREERENKDKRTEIVGEDNGDGITITNGDNNGDKVDNTGGNKNTKNKNNNYNKNIDNNQELVGIKIDKNEENKSSIEELKKGHLNKRMILFDINQDAYRSHIIGLIGRTGAGKTTLLSVLLNLAKVRKGLVLLDGVDLDQLPREILRQIVGVLPQLPFIFRGWTIRRFLDPRKLFSDDNIYEALEMCNLLEFVENLGENPLNLVILPDYYHKDMPKYYKKIYYPSIYGTNERGLGTSLNKDNNSNRNTNNKKQINIKINKVLDSTKDTGLILSNSQMRTLMFARLMLYRKFYRIILIDEPPSDNCSDDPVNSPTGISPKTSTIEKTESPREDTNQMGLPVYKLLSEYFKHCTTFIAAHDANALKSCSKLWILNRGNLVMTCDKEQMLHDDSLSKLIQECMEA